MNKLAQRLMQRGKTTGSNLPEAIFGTAGSLHTTLQGNVLKNRVALLPIRSEQSPQIAMGIQAILGYLLERYRQIRVYHLVARVGDSGDSYVWKTEDSQFGPQDWSLDDLDDNVRVWGQIKQMTDSWVLSLNLEREGDEAQAQAFAYEAGGLTQLVSLLPSAVSDLAQVLDTNDVSSLVPVYGQGQSINDEQLSQLLEQLSHWELQLYLRFLGQGDSESNLSASKQGLLTAGVSENDVSVWTISQAIARYIVYSGDDVDTVLWPLADEVADLFNESHISTVALATALFEVDALEQAYSLLVDRIESGGEVATYRALAELYRQGGRIQNALDTYQDAIEAEKVDAALYEDYANLLIVVDYNRMPVDAVVLVDPDEYPDDFALWEAVESYQEALALDPQNLAILSRQITQLIDIAPEDERIWQNFATLIEYDKLSEYTPAIIDALYSVDDLTPGIGILEAAIERDGTRLDLYLNLAALYTMDEEAEAAGRILHEARQRTDDKDILAEIEHLTLMAEDPEFDARLGEIAAIVNAGNEINNEDTDFLEGIVEKVPRFAEAYVLLARAYINWDEASSALETLLDGHKQVPDDPDIIALLSETLWSSNQQDLAFGYLKKGLSTNPNYVPLLALAGRYLFEDGQHEAARIYLARAEAIAPRHPALASARRYIATER